MAILEQYKEYEYLLNIDPKELRYSLFKNKELKEAGGTGKADINTIAEAIQKNHEASEEILNLTNDHIDTPMFRVMCKDLKTKLSDRALDIRNLIIQNVQDWCHETVTHINSTYTDMQN
jgi:capsid protein